ncbi:unnamed protein product, partial [Vitis vinifera]
MSQTNIGDDEVDIVIGALHADLTSFLNEWRPLFSRFHLIIVKDPDLREELKIPEGFNLHVYTKSDIDRVVGSNMCSVMKAEVGNSVKLMEEVVPFFQSVRLSQAAVTTEDCMLEIVALVKERLATLDPVFARAAQAMADWIKLWKAVGSGSGSSRPSNG